MTAIYSYSASDESATAFRRGWSDIFGQYQGTLFLVPSEAEATLIQLSPTIRFNCVLPPTTRQLHVSYYRDPISTYSIETPRLLLTQIISTLHYQCRDVHPCICSQCYTQPHPFYCKCEICQQLIGQRRNYVRNLFQIYACDITNAGFNYNLFNFANVYPDGKICFGAQAIPTNLRHANNNFWGSTFNNDFHRVELSHGSGSNCQKRKHTWRLHFSERNHYNTPCRRQVKHVCNNCQCRLYAKSPLHLFDCLMITAGCGCPCTCPCCSGSCQCICNCPCCLNVCSCSCTCDFNDDYAKYLHQTCRQAAESSYYSGTDLMGHNYVAIKNRIDAIFFSDRETILEKIESAHHRTISGKNCAIGFGRLIPDDEWEITFEDGQILLLGGKEVQIA